MKFNAHGTEVSFASHDIGHITNIEFGGRSRGRVQVTDNKSQFSHEFVAGIRNPGTVTLSCLYDPENAGQNALLENFDRQDCDTVEDVVVTLPECATTGSSIATLTFSAFVESFNGPTLPQDADTPATVSIVLAVSGNISQDVTS